MLLFVRRRPARLLRLPLLAAACLPAVPALAFTVDAEYAAQPGLATIKAAPAYALGISGAGVRVGVVDSGATPGHREFSGAIAAGANYFSGGALADSLASFHGSHVAGVVAARRDGLGMMGVAWGSQLVVAATNYSVDQLALGIDFTVANDVRVVNNSWGFSGNTVLDYDRAAVEAGFGGLVTALGNAVAADTVVVFANGNDGLAQPQLFGGLPYLFPEFQRHWITVIPSDIAGTGIPSYANRCGVAAAWCIVAPGGFSGDAGVYSVDGATTEGYKYLKGSSNAAPFASGSIALIAERFPWMTGAQLAATLLTTGTRGTDAVLSTIRGRGLIDLDKAMKGPAALEFDWDVDTAGLDATWSNAIIGSGALTKRGEGVLTLSGSNSFAGGVRLEGGGLRIAADTALGAAGAALVFDGGRLLANADLALGRTLTVEDGGGILDTLGFTVTLSGLLQGEGLLAKQGAGTLAFAGSSDFAGTLQVLEGTVQASAATLSGHLVNDATVIFQQDVDGSFAGDLSGSGQLRKQGSARLTLTGSNTVTGGMEVLAGELAGDGEALAGAISGAGTLRVEESGIATAAFRLDGIASVVKSGAGTLTLDAMATHAAGVVAVEAGGLRVATQLAADVSVASGATLALAGEVQGDVALASGATLARQASQAATISGDLALADGATLSLQLDSVPGAALAVAGAATVAGARLSIDAPGQLALSRHVLLQGGSVDGPFGELALAQAGLAAFLDYEADGVGLVLSRVDDSLLSSLAGRNRRAVAGALRQVLATGYYSDDLAAGLNAVYAAAAPATAVDTLSGEIAANAAPALQDLLGQAALLPFLAPATAVAGEYPAGLVPGQWAPGGWWRSAPDTAGTAGGAWVAAAGARGRVAGEVDAGGYESAWQLLALGRDAPVGSRGSVGLMLAQGRLDVSRDPAGDRAEADVVLAGLQASLGQGRVEWLGAAQAGRSEGERLRRVSAGTVVARARSDSAQDSLLLSAGLRARAGALPLGLRPLLLAQWLRVSTAAAQERGSGAFDLVYPEARQEFTQALAGLQWSLPATALPAGLTGQLSLLWQHAFSDAADHAVPVRFAVAPAAGFSLQPAGASEDRALLFAQAGYRFASGWQAGLSLSAAGGSATTSAGMALALDYRW